MRKLVLFLPFLFLSCSSDNSNDNCNFLFNASVNYNLNLNLPLFEPLQFVTNARYIPNQGNGGIIVINVGNGQLRAFDASDPSHAPSSCSVMTINGIEATCGCQDENTYNLMAGGTPVSGDIPCAMKEYRVSPVGNNNFIITN